MRLRWRSAILSRRSFFVLIFIGCSNSQRLTVYRSLRSRLAGLLLQHFTGVADALLLIRIRPSQLTDVGGHLANELPIDAGHRHMRLLVDCDVDSRRDVEDHRMRIAEREVHLLALHFRAVANADDVEILAEPFGDALDGVGDETAREAVELAELRILPKRPRLQMIAAQLEGDARRQRLEELTLGSLHLDSARLDVDLHALRNRDDFLANS